MDKFSDMAMFVSIVKHQGLAAAGRELGLSPATMTARLQALEERYGVKLLNRSTRHVSLTDSGELYHKACLEILDNVSEAENLIQNGVKEVKGPLKIAAPKDIGKQYILPILSEFCQQYPDVIPYLYLNDNLSNIAESGMDVVIRYWALKGEGIALKSVLDVQDDINNQRLVTLLNGYMKNFNTSTSVSSADLNVVYISKKYQPKRIRLFLDFLIENFGRLTDKSIN
ncbi:LysR family transcriptional regulator [Vibrio chagasii]|uniref:LysR family transcriptional regulator n=1 Tax=Vibrio chagasii TaxID=170679 RepID=UPI003DAA0B2F